MQAEADLGWLLAEKSAEMAAAVADAAVARGRPPVATLENPLPSGPPLPSGFYVDGVRRFLENPECEAAEFNSCSYPPRLCEAYADLVATAWADAAAKERPARALAEEGRGTPPLSGLVAAAPAEVTWRTRDCGNMARTGAETRKERREAENLKHIGGMRNPATAVGMVPGLGAVGLDIYRRFTEFASQHPEALAVADSLGTKDYEGPDATLVVAWADVLRKCVGAPGARDREARPGRTRFQSPLDGALIDAWLRAAGDPEVSLGPWVTHGVPLGIEAPIPTHGVFPSVDDTPEPYGAPPLEEAFVEGIANYASFTAQDEDARFELDRYIQAGFGEVVDFHEAPKAHPARSRRWPSSSSTSATVRRSGV